MKLKKYILFLFIAIILIFVLFNIKNFFILKKIYDNNEKITLNNFYYQELSYNNTFNNQSTIYCKDKKYLLNYCSTTNNTTYYEAIWVDDNTGEFIAYENSNKTNNEWKSKNDYIKYSIDNPKSIVSVCHVSYNNNLIDLIISNLFNNVKTNKDGLYYIKANNYEYYIDKNTYICKKIDSKKYDIHIEIIEYTENIINNDITPITIDDLQLNNETYI